MVCLLYAAVHELKKFIELSALQALQLAYNTGGVQVFLHIVLCFTGNQVPAPTIPCISQATQVPLEFLAVLLCSDQSEQPHSIAKLGISYVLR